MSSTKKPKWKSTQKTIKACRICLAMDRKLYQMKKHNLYSHYEEITGLSVNEVDRLPRKLCWECAHRLVSYHRFKNKALRAHGLMIQMLRTAKYLTSQDIVLVNRNKNNLISCLTENVLPSDHTDLYLENTSPISGNVDSNPDSNKIEILQVDIQEAMNNHSDVDYNYIDENSLSSDVVLARRKKKLKNKKKHIEKIDRRKKPASEVLSNIIFDITDLSYEEQVSDIKKRQDTSNYKNSEYKCMECFKGFLDVDAYKGHMFRHTDQSGIYECDICKIRFKKQHALRNHMTSHMQKFSCKQCPYVTTRRHAAKLHEEYHNGTRYQCPHCQEDFVKISTYMSHVRIKHPSDFVCELCGHSFVSAKGLVLHKKLKHRCDEQPIPENGPCCVECDVRFVNTEALERHLKLSARHNDDAESPRKRSRRPRDTADRTNEKNHRNAEEKKRRGTCKPEGPISCEQCDMQLPDSLSYYRHFRRSHPDKNRTNYPSMKSKSMCEVCGKMFQSLALLVDHSFTHTDSKQFKCATCGKRFQRKYRLIAHARVHAAAGAGARAPHACRLCDKRFSTASNMQRHMFSHTGLKPFKCEMCGKCFKHASEKRVHITYVHLKKPWPKRTRGKRREDGRQNQMPPLQAAPINTNDMDIVQPLWPACNDPKIGDILIDDKATYYNMKN